MKFRNTSVRHHNKVLKTLLQMRKPYKQIVPISDDFYKSCNLKIEIVEISLNYLSAKGYIELLPPENNLPPKAIIKAEAYTYFPDLKERMMIFWIPIIISIILSVASLVVSIVAIVLNLSN